MPGMVLIFGGFIILIQSQFLQYPKTTLICGLCANPEVIWIDSNELSKYQNGQRIFSGPTEKFLVKVIILMHTYMHN